jgi:hypothetical protein
VKLEKDHLELKDADPIYATFKPNQGKETKVLIKSNPSIRTIGLFPPARMPDEHWKEYWKALEPSLSEFSIIIEEPRKDPEKWVASQLYSALLIMFNIFGYEYILSPNFGGIRQALLGQNSLMDYKNSILAVHNTSAGKLPHFPYLGIQTAPKDLQSFYIAFQSPRRSDIVRLVFLPGFGESGKESHAKLMSMTYKASDRFNFKGTPPMSLRGKDILSNPQSKGLCELIWNHFTRN